MGYLELLKESAEERKSILCMGIDPVLEKMPYSLMQPREEKIIYYFSQIIDSALNEKYSIGAIKPNYAYFAQYGFDGLRALKSLIEKYSGKIPIILDAKRGDIEKSSQAYAKEAYDFWGADAVTVSPYMGYDSLKPFIDRCNTGKGAYVLCRTSNAGASDFQSLLLDNNRQLFMEVAKKIAKWWQPGIGAVLGATAQEELESAAWIFYDEKKSCPFLIPGIGEQGGSLEGTIKTLKAIWNETFLLHRINCSSEISYAYKDEMTDDFIGSALRKIRKLNEKIGKI